MICLGSLHRAAAEQTHRSAHLCLSVERAVTAVVAIAGCWSHGRTVQHAVKHTQSELAACLAIDRAAAGSADQASTVPFLQRVTDWLSKAEQATRELEAHEGCPTGNYSRLLLWHNSKVTRLPQCAS